MAYYDALIAEWANHSGTTAEKLAAVNAMTVAGRTVDVPIGDVLAYLSLQGKVTGLKRYVAAGTGNATALVAADELLTLLMSPNVSVFRLSDPATYTAVSAFLDALMADTGSGIVAADKTALLALASSTLPWWQANGYSGPIGTADLTLAGGLS